TAPRTLKRAHHDREVVAERTRALLDRVGRAQRAVAGPHLTFRLMCKRPVDDAEQSVVLPKRQAEREGDRGQRDDHPRAQLVQVLDDAHAVLVADPADRDGHGESPRYARDSGARVAWGASSAATAR